MSTPLNMTDTMSSIQTQLDALRLEVKDLRSGFLSVNRHYIVTIESLKDLTERASEAAKLSLGASLKAVSAAKNAVFAAAAAADHGLVSAINFSAKSAEEAIAAAIAVAHQAEESAILASAAAAEASKIAAGAAVEAVKISNQASELARTAGQKTP